jgi:hypothetical protein
VRLTSATSLQKLIAKISQLRRSGIFRRRFRVGGANFTLPEKSNGHIVFP